MIALLTIIVLINAASCVLNMLTLMEQRAQRRERRRELLGE